MMIGHTNDAQDILQETLLAAYEGLPRFEGRAAVRTWLVGILTRQVALNRRQKAARRTTSLDAHREDADESNSSSAIEPTVKSSISATDARLDLMELMARLNDEHRQVLILRELVGLTYDEIADLLDLPRGTVESRLFRARQMLREVAEPASNKPQGPARPERGVR